MEASLQVPELTEQSAKSITCPFEFPSITSDGKCHIGIKRGDLEQPEEAEKVRVCWWVKHNLK